LKADVESLESKICSHQVENMTGPDRGRKEASYSGVVDDVRREKKFIGAGLPTNSTSKV